MLPRRSTDIYPKELAPDMREFFNSLLIAEVFVQCLSDDTHIRPRHQFRSVDPGEKHFGYLVAGLLLELNRRNVFKIEIGLGLLKKKKPCHRSLLLSASQTVKRSWSWRSLSREAIDQASSRWR